MDEDPRSNYRPAPPEGSTRMSPAEAMRLGEQLRERHAAEPLDAEEIIAELRAVARRHGADYRDVRFGYIARDPGPAVPPEEKAA